MRKLTLILRIAEHICKYMLLQVSRFYIYIVHKPSACDFSMKDLLHVPLSPHNLCIFFSKN